MNLEVIVGVSWVDTCKCTSFMLFKCCLVRVIVESDVHCSDLVIILSVPTVGSDLINIGSELDRDVLINR